MYFFNATDELLFYYPNSGGYCYCERLLNPQDMTLQGKLPKVSASATVVVEAYQPNGVDFIETITPYFKGIIGVDTNGGYYFNLILQSFPPMACLDCFVVRVKVTDVVGGSNVVVFDKYTQQYCVPDCCASEGQLEAGEGDQKEIFTSQRTSSRLDGCGNPIVQIRSTYPCFDNNNGDYYGKAVRIIKGINNSTPDDVVFYKITNIEALFKRLPREIKTTISLNCKVQKTESTRQWMLQSKQFVPTWKMDEMEGQFLANVMLINGTEYRIQTTVPFSKVAPYQRFEVQEYFRLDTVVEACRIWQIFGCGTNCVDLNRLAYAPLKVGETLYKVFDSDGALIALTQADFVTYLLSQEGITAVTDVSYVYASYGYSSVLMIESENGYVPSYFYLNYVGANSKWPMVAEVIDLFIGCQPAVVGTITDASYACDAAALGTITDVAASLITQTVLDFGDWTVQPGSIATLVGPTVRLTFTSRNLLLANSQAQIGDVVGYVTDSFVPAEERTLTANLAADTYVVVGQDGTIRWFGPLTDSTPSYGEVEFINVTYNI